MLSDKNHILTSLFICKFLRFVFVTERNMAVTNVTVRNERNKRNRYMLIIFTVISLDFLEMYSIIGYLKGKGHVVRVDFRLLWSFDIQKF